MHCEGKSKLGSLDTSYCLIEVVTKAGLMVYCLLMRCYKYHSVMVLVNEML